MNTAHVPFVTLADDYTALQYLAALLTPRAATDGETREAILASLLSEDVERRLEVPLQTVLSAGTPSDRRCADAGSASLPSSSDELGPACLVLTASAPATSAAAPGRRRRRHPVSPRSTRRVSSSHPRKGGDDAAAVAVEVVALLARPRLCGVFGSLTLRWARVAAAEAARQYAARCRIARLQTIGGGWASLRRADKALACTLELHAAARSVWDEDTASKCRLFAAWALLWNGQRRLATALFASELRAALAAARDTGGGGRSGHAEDSLVHVRRCQNALANALHNPTFRNGAGGGHTRNKKKGGHPFELTDCWTSVFTDAAYPVAAVVEGTEPAGSSFDDPLLREAESQELRLSADE